MEPSNSAPAAETLMGQYCDGDSAAFHALYALVAGKVLAYLVGLVGDRATAEDLLQLTFLKLHQARAGYVRGANPVPWIYTIAHRTFLDEARRRKRSRTRLTSDGVAPDTSAADLDGTATLARTDEPDSEASAAAMAALSQLPERQREALLLTKIHGRSLAEAAAITGTTPGAIKLRAHRAYVTLRGLLGRSPRGAAGVAPAPMPSETPASKGDRP
jgi:RNA polymerase sigma-70 factor (ECF subfamily)